MVACPPQVTMLMFGASRCSLKLTAGTTNGPIAAGVRSISRLPNGASLAAFATCALAEVASNTMPISPKPGRAIIPSTPSAVVATFSRAARANPSEAASMPTIAPNSRFCDTRITLIIRSVPILPDPIAATFIRRMSLPYLENVTLTAPRTDSSAVISLPGSTITIAPNAPDKTTSPSRNGAPNDAAMRATHTNAFNGSPRQAAPSPLETSTPSLARLIVTSSGANSLNGTRLSPNTNKPLEALSATVSVIVISQSATLESTISNAAT